MRIFSKNHTKMINQSLRLVTIVTAAAILAVGCSAGAGGSGAAQTNLAPRPVKTEAIAKRSIGSPVEQVAEVSAANVLDVVSKASGEVLEVRKKRGEYVQKDDVLFLIDQKDAASGLSKSELALQSARDSLQKAREDLANNRKDLVDAIERAGVALTNAERDYNRIRNEFDAGQVVQQQVDMAKQQADNARMSLQSAQNKLSALESTNALSSIETQAKSATIAVEDATRMLDNYSVKAPATGFLTDFGITVGQMVMSGGKIGQVQQVDPIKLSTELTESNYKLALNKQELVFYNPDTPDQKKTAKVSYLAPVMSAQTKSYTLELEVPNPDQTIKPGSRMMIQLTTETEQLVLTVPTLSIIREESSTFVFILEGTQYRKRAVKLGRMNGAYQEILEGVKEGEQLVITGQNQLKDGQQAEPSK
jgi:multidrug efflux pump subunit AcrA (membrane-fusion protein)